MSIESKIPTEEINIKDLSLGKSENNSLDLFDMEKEISNADWENVTMSAWKIRDTEPDFDVQDDRWLWYSDMLMDIKMTSPDKFASLIEQDYDWDFLSAELESHGTMEPWRTLRLSDRLFQLFPERFKAREDLLEKASEVFDFMEFEGINEGSAGNDNLGRMIQLIRLSPLFGKLERLTLLVQSIEPALEEACEELVSRYHKELQKKPDKIPQRINIQAVGLVDSFYYLNYFKAFLGKDLQIPTAEISGLINKFLEAERPTQPDTAWNAFMEETAKIKTIYSKEIKFTKQGVELIAADTESIFSPSLPLPEIKKF